MKTDLLNGLTALLTIVALFAGCSTNEIAIEPDPITSVKMNAKSSVEDIKFGFGESEEPADCKWGKSESFDVFIGNEIQKSVKFNMTSGTGESNAVFTATFVTAPEAEEKIYAIYPSVGESTNPTSLVLDLTSQSLAISTADLQNNKSHYLLSEATYDDNNELNFRFAHKVAILKLPLTFPATAGSIKKVELEGIYSTAALDMTTGKLSLGEIGKSMLSDENGKALVENKMNVYLYLFPSDLTAKRIKISATDETGEIFETEINGYNFEAGTIYSYPRDIAMETLEVLPVGEIGRIYNMFGFQLYKNDGRGFTAGGNRTMTVVGDYLIIPNVYGNNHMLVLNRYTGETLSKKVNFSGINNPIYAVASDDNGVMAAICESSNQFQPQCEIWIWENGIEAAPRCIFNKNILTDDYFEPLRGGNYAEFYSIGGTFYVKGDIVSGKAVVGTACSQKLRMVFFSFMNGAPSTPKAQVELHYFEVAMGNNTKPIILNTDDTPEYFWGTSNDIQRISYVPAGARESNVSENVTAYYQPTVNWYTSGNNGSWMASEWRDIKGVDFVEFNGLNIIAVQNACYDTSEGLDHINRLYVANLTPKTDRGALIDKFIFDSATDNLDIPGAGYSITGLTHRFSFVEGRDILGPNSSHSGDVCIGKSKDGNKIQIYMLTTDHGLIAYELTRYKKN